MAPSWVLRQPTSLFLQLIQDIARLQRRSLRHSRQLEVPDPTHCGSLQCCHTPSILGTRNSMEALTTGPEPGHRYVLFVLAVLQKSEPVSPEWCLPHIQNAQSGPQSPEPWPQSQMQILPAPCGQS